MVALSGSSLDAILIKIKIINKKLRTNVLQYFSTVTPTDSGMPRDTQATKHDPTTHQLPMFPIFKGAVSWEIS